MFYYKYHDYWFIFVRDRRQTCMFASIVCYNCSHRRFCPAVFTVNHKRAQDKGHTHPLTHTEEHKEGAGPARTALSPLPMRTAEREICTVAHFKHEWGSTAAPALVWQLKQAGLNERREQGGGAVWFCVCAFPEPNARCVRLPFPVASGRSPAVQNGVSSLSLSSSLLSSPR